jgi:hypothetical protein
MKTLRLGELLVAEGLLTKKELDEALTAQQIYGGRLGTVLVEHGFVHEDDVARLLARQLGVPVAGREDLLEVSSDVINLVPQALATRFGIVPYRFNEVRNRVTVAMADPTNLQRSDEIQFALGRSAEFTACPEIVLSHALEKYYGITRERRFIRIDLGTDTGRTRVGSRAEAAAEPAVSKKEGILGLLINATTKERAIECVLDWLATFGDQAAFLVACGPALAAWGARGVGFAPNGVLHETCRIAESPAACAALVASGPITVALDATDAMREGLETRLGMECSGRVVLAPLAVHDQPFGLFAITRLRNGVTLDLLLVSELVRRLSFRLQALQLMELVSAPLGNPSKP